MANLSDTVFKEPSARTPEIDVASNKLNAPPTLTRQRSVVRQLDDSFSQLGIGQRPSVGLHENAEAERTDTTFFLMSELQKLSDEFRHYRMSEVHRNEEITKLISECRTRDELIQQKDAVIMSLVSSLKEQMSSATSPREASGEDSKTYLKPASMAQYPGTLQHGTSTEYRPEMATFSKEASLATGKYVDMESGLKPHSLGTEVSDVKSHSQQTETQKIKTVTEVANGSSKQPEQTHDTTPNAHTTSAGTSGVKMKPATFDGSTSWLDYKTHFDMCAELNGWSIVQKGLYLAVSLRGHAQGVLGNLPAEDRNNFEKLIKALSERFSPESQTELYRAQLKERQWKHGENIPEFGQRILRLTTLAYPGANASLIDTLAMGNFIDSISDSDMRLKIQQTRPKVFNEAVKVAVELEAFDKAERQRQGNKYVRGTSSNSTPDDVSSETTVILQKLSKFLDQADATNTPSSSDVRGQYSTQRKVRCYKCKKLGHIQRNCPYNKNQSTESTENRKGQGEGSSMKRVGRFCDKRSSRKRARKSKRIASTRCVEAGMYLPVQINGIHTDMLIDSGATASLISVEVFNKMANQPILKPVKGQMVAVNGMNLKTHRFCDFDVIIGGFCYSVRAIVAELNTSGILGLDFLSDYECAIDIKQKCIVLDGKRIRCDMKGKIGCYRVSLMETVSILPRHEMLISCQINDYCHDIKGTGIVEPSDDFHRKSNVMIGRTLATADENVPVRIMNPLNEEVVVYKGTIVGQFEQVNGDSNNMDLKRKQKSVLPDQLEELVTQASVNLDEEQCKSVRKTLLEYQDVFALTDEQLGRTEVVKHEINTGSAKPIKQRLRRLPHYAVDEVDRQVDDMLKRGIIEHSNSPWAAGVVLVRKKDNTLRFCVDYRDLNAVTLKDAHALPKIDETLDTLSGVSWFSTLDLRCGYWQVGLEEKDKAKTAFITHKGLYNFRVLPFGLCNAPVTFERLMETVLAGLQWDICLIYIDDIIVYGKTFKESLKNIETVFERLRIAGLKLKAPKCKLFSKSVSFLGHIISDSGIKTDPEKISAVKEWPIPVNVTEVRSFLGLCSYYRRFIPKFADIARPLHRLTEKGQKFVWNSECEQAFGTLKKYLTEAPILAYPDFSKPFILDTDASDTSIGAVLSQVHEGKERVVCYGSRSLTKSERKYCVTRKELLSLVHFVKHYRHYLLGKQFKIRTDHNSLRWLMKTKNPEGQMARWIDALSSYQFDVEHRPGRKHSNANDLSRIPCGQCGYQEEPVCIRPVKATISMEDEQLKNEQVKDADISIVRSWLDKDYGKGAFFKPAV